LGAAGRARAEQLFSIGRHNLALLALYESLLRNKQDEMADAAQGRRGLRGSGLGA
jgi:hypothetical protein